MNTYHCGCREHNEEVIACARHACNPLMAYSEQRRCPMCSSQSVQLSPAGIHFDCQRCGCRFPVRVEK